MECLGLACGFASAGRCDELAPPPVNCCSLGLAPVRGLHMLAPLLQLLITSSYLAPYLSRTYLFYLRHHTIRKLTQTFQLQHARKYYRPPLLCTGTAARDPRSEASCHACDVVRQERRPRRCTGQRTCSTTVFCAAMCSQAVRTSSASTKPSCAARRASGTAGENAARAAASQRSRACSSRWS